MNQATETTTTTKINGSPVRSVTIRVNGTAYRYERNEIPGTEPTAMTCDDFIKWATADAIASYGRMKSGQRRMQEQIDSMDAAEFVAFIAAYVD